MSRYQILQRVLAAEADASSLREKFLTASGWEQTCDFPDSCWRWCKQIKGKVLALTRDQAFKLECHLFEDERNL